MSWIRWRPGLFPGPCWGSSRHSTIPLVGWRRGHPSSRSQWASNALGAFIWSLVSSVYPPLILAIHHGARLGRHITWQHVHRQLPTLVHIVVYMRVHLSLHIRTLVQMTTLECIYLLSGKWKVNSLSHLTYCCYRFQLTLSQWQARRLVDRWDDGWRWL